MIVEMTEQQFRKHMQENDHVIAFFYTPFCANCSYARKVIEIVLNRLDKNIQIVSGNLNLMPSLAEPLRIMTVPLLLFIDKGKPKAHFVSFGRADELYNALIKFYEKIEKE